MKKQAKSAKRKKQSRKPRSFYIKRGLLVLLALLFLFYVVLEVNACIFSYQWSGTYPDHWNLQWCEDLINAFHTDFHYLSEKKHLKTLGSPDGTWEELAVLCASRTPTEHDAVLPDNGVPHHIFFEIAVPEQGFSLRMHNALKDSYSYPDQIIITGEQIRFGRRGIGIGSTRQDVERAYRIEAEYAAYNVISRLITTHRLLPEERAEDFALGYRIGYRDWEDTGLDVLFRFDENDRVDMIVLNHGRSMPRW